MKPTSQCWCGNLALRNFSADYNRCAECETLVVKNMPEPQHFRVENDQDDFYGKQYHLSHVTSAFGQDNIFTRSRTDLPERCLHWMKTVLKYTVPRGAALELGSAHGAFVFLLKCVGFEAKGLELSPWLGEYARETFGVETLTGAIEQQEISPASLDVIAMMDVLEHFPDPLSTLKHCTALLKHQGIMVIQTPRYPEQTSFDILQERSDPFLEHLKPREHIFLFSERSVTLLLRKLGFDHVSFEPAIFSRYDMFPVASRAALERVKQDVVEHRLLATPEGRLVLGLIDLSSGRR